jgi:predicted alpha-1,2-mannosidase
MIIHRISSMLKSKKLFLLLLFLSFSILTFSKDKKHPVSSQLTSSHVPSLKAKVAKSFKARYEVRNLIPYVDQNIGVDVGKCSFGVSMPFGSIRPCPHTRNSRNGYDPKEKICGFTNVNSGMVNKYVNLLVSPQTGLSCWDEGENKATEYDSDKANEVSRPDYYSVDLTRYGIQTEVTSAQNTAIYRITYPETHNGEASMMIYPSHSLSSKYTFSTIAYDAKNNMIKGYLILNDGWYFAHGTIYYAIKFSKPVQSFGMFDNVHKKLHDNSDTISGDGVGCYLKFNTTAKEKVYMKVSISTKSIANAQNFVNNEIPGWDFEKVKTNASKTWKKDLSAILIDDEDISNDDKTCFYTALYYSLLSPKKRTGDCPWNYSGPYYDDEFCIWDTFRSEFPFLTLIKESVVRDNIQSFNEVFKHNGYVNDAFLCGLGDMVQGGDDVDIVIADAYAKGVAGVNWKDAYKLLKGHATLSGRTPLYRKNDLGWVPYNTIPKMAYATASKTMEFAYNDFCLSKVAEGLGFKDDKDRFLKRSTKWINLWNPDVKNEGFSGFITSKDTTGKWEVLNPNENPGGSFSKHFYEGNSWTYSFFVPHQMDKLINLMGGKSTFTKRLETYVANKIEITNEPCFLTPYLFTYVARPDLTSMYVRQISTTNFTRNAYPGDEDSGAMSTWLMFAKLGFFPVAGQDLYLINGPRYKKVTIQMENGKNIVIYGKNASADNKYVKSVTLNGKSLQQAWFKHSEIKNGAVLDFQMDSTPSTWGLKGNLPPSY